jgi:23S rRNA pseudouridine1911/1915/1917 synthase
MTENENHEKLRELEFEALLDDEGERLDLFLNDRMEWRSRSSIKKLISKGQVALKNRESAVKASLRVRPGDVIGVRIPVPKRDLELSAAGADLDMDVLHEDRWILAVNKPAGVPVHPAGRLLDRTVITELRRRLHEAEGIDPENVKLCHRLDLETSGVLLVSKDPVTMPRISEQFENRSASKEYLAIVHGEMKQESGEIDLPIGLARKSLINMKRGIRRVGGQPARTGFRVEERYRGFTLVRLKLFTGRHHQIRVHLSAIGHPIVGDKVYGLDERFFLMYFEGKLDDEAMERLLLPRQALHAQSLTVLHPGLEERVSIEAPLPDDLREFLKGLEKC